MSVPAFSHKPLDILWIAPVTSGQGPAVGIAKALNEPLVEIPYGLDGASSLLGTGLWGSAGIRSAEIPQKDGPGKEGAAYGLA